MKRVCMRTTPRIIFLFLKKFKKMTTSAYLPKIPCSVEILTRNSAATLERCLESVKDFAEIIVLDGNSTDATLAIARKFNCKIYKQYETDEPEIKIKNYAEVRNKGLRLASFAWFLYIDSDEYLSREVVGEIRSVIQNPSPAALIWRQPRKYVFRGKVIECATTYPNRQIRFFHKAAIKGFLRPVHERVEIKEGERVGYLQYYEYVPLESFAALSGRWKHYLLLEEKRLEGVSRYALLKKMFYTLRTVAVYALRLARLMFCRGARLPLIFEIGRQWYNFRLLALLFRKLVAK